MRTAARFIPLVARITGLPGAPVASTNTSGDCTTLYLQDGTQVELFATDLVSWEPLDPTEGETMSKVTITLTPEDVATLRAVFHLALVQSEAVLDDADGQTLRVVESAARAHNAVVSLMSRIDATLPDSTGFFA